MIIERVLCGLKSSGAAWREKIAETLMQIGYKSFEVDSNVWMKRYFNPNGEPYYKYMLCYVDDLLHKGFKPKEDMDVLNIIYLLKKVFGPTDLYLSANIEKVQLKYGRVVSTCYVMLMTCFTKVSSQRKTWMC